MELRENAVRQKLERRRAVYLEKRDQRDAGDDDSLNLWEKYDFAAEVVEVIATELGYNLFERDE